MSMTLKTVQDKGAYEDAVHVIKKEFGAEVIFVTISPVNNPDITKWWKNQGSPWILRLVDKDNEAHLFIDVGYGHLILVTSSGVTIHQDFVESDGYCAFAESIAHNGGHEKLYKKVGLKNENEEAYTEGL